MPDEPTATAASIEADPKVRSFFRDLRESMPDPYAAIYCPDGRSHRCRRRRLFRRSVCQRCGEQP